ncbi:DUF1648 domain-containing protein [Cryobacterium melibiosiphilum]|nr:DUF1648 domain-containing protein [Cryobacterium melibiosiphilum]
MTFASRPPANFHTSGLVRRLRWSGLAAAAIATVIVAAVYGGLPEQIPTHFGASGQADAWGPRSSVWPLLGVWLLVQALLAFLSTWPRMFNYPVPVTEANAQRLYRDGEGLMVFMGVSVAIIFTGLVLLSVGAPGFPLVGVGLAFLLAVLVVGVGRLMRSPWA